ncbi:MAG: hypothetical protein J2P25_23365 [Nocardiopsaceae bacterium]|nr:hypothetical protein [Nocardiopsaceae bacterium]
MTSENEGTVGAWRTVVTGAETDLGRRVAVALAKRGSTIDLLCADETGAAGAVSVLSAVAPEALGQVEVADPADLSAMVAACARLAVNPISALVHAGVYATAQPRGDALGLPWLTTVNVIAPYVTTRALAPSLLRIPDYIRDRPAVLSGGYPRPPYGRVIFLSPPYLGPRVNVGDLRTGGDIMRFSYVTYRARTLLAVELARRSERLSIRTVMLLGGVQPAPGASSRQVASYRWGQRGGRHLWTRWFLGAPLVDEVSRTAAYLATAERVPGDAGRWCARSPRKWRKLHKGALDPSPARDVWSFCEELSAPVSLPGGL